MKRILQVLMKHKKISFVSAISILFTIIFYLGNSWLSCRGAKLTHDPIEAKIQKLSYEEGVAQLLMIGLDADYLNYKKSTHFQKVIAELGVGFVIMNTYNYHSSEALDNEYLTSIHEFNNAIQRASTKSKSRIPIAIATDFEGPSYSSIRGGLMLPPSALSMGASQDAQLIKMMGQFVGNELSSIGIHLILGPVVDTYNGRQGNKSTLQDRCFCGSPQGAIGLASHYIDGLSAGKVASVIKHVPSYGSVEDNPHDYVIPEFPSSKNDLINELEWIYKLNGNVAGMMTSHVSISFLTSEKFTTTSNEFISHYIPAKVRDNLILMTDDLTSMGAARKYRADNRLGFVDLAVQAFKSGHDVLLFSHFTKHNGNSDLDIKTLQDVIVGLAQYVENNDSAKVHYKSALRKILTLKSKLARSNGGSEQSILGEQTSPISDVKRIPSNYIQDSEQFLVSNPEGLPHTSKDLVLDIIKSGTVNINEAGSVNINLLSHGSKILFCIQEDGLQPFVSAFQTNFPNAIFVSLPKIKNGKSFQQAKNTILKSCDMYDKIVYTASDKSDADLITSLQNKCKGASGKFVVFCNGNPIMFDEVTLRSIPLVAHFTNHPLSYNVSIQVLEGSFTPPPPRKLPIRLGDTGKFLSMTDKWPEPSLALPQNEIPLQAFDKRNDAIQYLQPTHIIIEKSMSSYLLVALISVFSLFLCRVMKSLYLLKSSDENFSKLYLIALKHYFVIPLLVFVLLLTLLSLGTFELFLQLADQLAIIRQRLLK